MSCLNFTGKQNWDKACFQLVNFVEWFQGKGMRQRESESNHFPTLPSLTGAHGSVSLTPVHFQAIHSWVQASPYTSQKATDSSWGKVLPCRTCAEPVIVTIARQKVEPKDLGGSPKISHIFYFFAPGLHYSIWQRLFKVVPCRFTIDTAWEG